MKKKLMFLLVVVLGLSSQAYCQKDKKLRVMYVGYNPAASVEVPKGRFETENQYNQKLRRWSDFGMYLYKHFENVSMVNASDYTPDMSEKVDVTIFDARPKVLRKQIVEKDASGKVIRFEAVRFLPEDFSAACITVGVIGGEFGRGHKSKIDWA